MSRPERPLRLVVVLLVLGSVALGLSLSRRHAPSGSEEAPEARAGKAIELLQADFANYTKAEQATWYTAIPISMRNIGGGAITVESIEVDSVDNLAIDRIRALPPSAPSIAGNVFPRWPPVVPATDERLPNFHPRRVSGTRLRTGKSFVGGMPTTREDGHEVANDRVDDVPVAFRIRQIDPSKTGRAVGLDVRYRIGEQEFHLHAPHVEFGVCSVTDFARQSCQEATN